jgi:hypothetical protein
MQSGHVKSAIAQLSLRAQRGNRKDAMLTCKVRDCFVVPPTHDMLYLTCYFTFRIPRDFITRNDKKVSIAWN